MATFITSDLHLFHDREFIWGPRGFQSCKEMTNYYIDYWKRTVNPEDTVYVVGDFCLGTDINLIKETVESLPGTIILIRGNHDTDNKVKLYEELGIRTLWADRLVYGKQQILLSHYITETASLESDPKNCVLNAHGHLHVKKKHYEDRPYLYNVSMDANDNKFVILEQIVESFKEEIKKCISLL